MSVLLAAVLFCACVFLGNGKARVLRVRRQTLTAMEDDWRKTWGRGTHNRVVEGSYGGSGKNA